MGTYIFDGSFEGMLSAIYQASYMSDKYGQILFHGMHQENLFTQIHSVETEQTKADKVYSAIKNKISREALEHIMYAFLSGDENIGTFIYHYLNLGWKTGNKLDMYLDDTRVKRIHDLSSKVKFEKHRMLGLLRFRRLSLHYEVYYAPFEPDNNITMLLAPHFAQRLSDQNWIIHDIKRSIAACYNTKEWMMTELTSPQIPPLGEDEKLYQYLWKQYYQSISISGRQNPRLQRQMMPARYWRYLTEKTP
ncbi:MAG: TIGR03915 family putative DNA repair protein [Dehalobacterium sp.]